MKRRKLKIVALTLAVSLLSLFAVSKIFAAFPSDLVRTKNWGNEVLTDSDLEGQLDLIINWVMAAINSSTGHAHDGTSNQGPKITANSALKVTSQATGDLIYASSATAFTRLAVGTATQVLHGGATPAYSAIVSGDLPTGTVVQVVNTISGAVATGTTTMPNDDTIPQNTEGTEWMTLAITPKATTNKLRIDVVWYGSIDNADVYSMALFQDTTMVVHLTHYMAAGTTSATTFKVRGGPNSAGTATFNGVSGGRIYGGVAASTITITEIVSS